MHQRVRLKVLHQFVSYSSNREPSVKTDASLTKQTVTLVRNMWNTSRNGSWVCHYDTLFLMRLGCLLLVAMVAAGQTTDEDFHVSREHPRILLTPQRLRLLKRERERKSPRWEQFETLIAGKAVMPEPTLAYGLYFQVTGDAGAAKTAGTGATDLRSLALAYDWLPDYRSQIEPKLKAALSASQGISVDAVRSRALAAVVLDNDKVLEQIVRVWWRQQVAPALKAGKRVLSNAEVYPMLELMHVIRDNLNIDLREDARLYFRDFATSRILSYYPATFPAPENDFHIPFGPVDLKIAALTRIAELSLVAFDNNATDHQFVQGWLMHDHFVLKGAFGAPYEFLWANPYQPGLSYDHLPLTFYDPVGGRLFMRSSWEEDATWLGYVDGKAQVFREGSPQPVQLDKPLTIGKAMILTGKPAMRLEVQPDGPSKWFVVGLKPASLMNVEADDEELDEVKVDRGGILQMDFKRKDRMVVRLKLR